MVDSLRPSLRLIVVGVIQNTQDQVLICKMPQQRGVFPGQWGLPGGGIEEGETAEVALRRELVEEVGLEVENVQPLFFTDAAYAKTFTDGSQQEFYMVFLLFACRASSGEVRLNDEFTEFAWVNLAELQDYDINIETARTFRRLGWL